MCVDIYAWNACVNVCICMWQVADKTEVSGSLGIDARCRGCLSTCQRVKFCFKPFMPTNPFNGAPNSTKQDVERRKGLERLGDVLHHSHVASLFKHVGSVSGELPGCTLERLSMDYAGMGIPEWR